MKQKALISLALFGLAGAMSAAITINGTAVLNPVGTVPGKNTAWVVGVPGLTIDAGLLAGPVPGSSLIGVGSGTTVDFFGNATIPGGFGFDQIPFIGQQLSVMVFDTSPLGEAVGGDTYQFWTDAAWVVPAGDGTYTFGTELPQLTGVAANGSGTVVPEPSTYAMLAGALALVAVMIRRRR